MYHKEDATGNYQIYKISSGGGAEIPLTSDSYDHELPQWSPDGSEIAYHKEDATGWRQIYKIPSTGGIEIPLTSDSYNHRHPQWSPDGSEIVYDKVDATGYAQIYKISSTGICETPCINPNKLSLDIFPNPAKTFFEIHSQEPVKNLQIYNVTGQLIKEERFGEYKPTQKISLEGLNSGVYFVRLKGEDFTSKKKLLFIR